MSTVTKAAPTEPHKRSYNLPPGPRGAAAAIRNLREFRADSLGKTMALVREYGDILCFRVGPRRIFLLSHPDHAEQVMGFNNKNYDKGLYAFQIMKAFFGEGLFTSDGNFWRRQRKLVQPGFHSSRIAGFGQTMVRNTEEMLAEWETIQQPVEMYEEMVKLVLCSICSVLFGVDARKESGDFHHGFKIVNDTIIGRIRSVNPASRWLPTPNNLAFWATGRHLHKIVEEMVVRRRADQEDRGDLLSMLLQARYETGEPMTAEQIRDEVMIQIFAGHETTANSLTFTWYLLDRNPHTRERLEEELERVLGGRLPTVADLEQLEYTRAVVLESLRMYPPAHVIVRRAVNDDVMAGYDIPANSNVMVSTYATQRHPKFWDHPEVFDPLRFIPERSETRPYFAYFPFGGGPRVCIGNAVGKMNAVLSLATIAQRVRVHVPADYTLVPAARILVCPKYGLPATIVPRKPRLHAPTVSAAAAA